MYSVIGGIGMFFMNLVESAVAVEYAGYFSADGWLGFTTYELL